jgi:hypothetical protein
MFFQPDEDSTMQCRKCQSPNVFLCPAAHAQGTVTTTAKSTPDVFPGNSAYQANMSVSTTSTSQTAFAQRWAPPTSSLRWAILATLVMLSVNVATQIHLHVKGLFAGTGTHVMLGILAACVLWLILAIRNYPNYRKSLKRWRETWVCASCGHFFLAEG